MQHVDIDANWLDSEDFSDLAATVDRQPVIGWSTDYTPEFLRWRLAQPDTAYTAHIGDDVALITTRSTLGPIPSCVVLKIFPLSVGIAPTDATRAIRSAIRWHRAGFGAYIGFNGSVQVRGFNVPRRLQRSPLDLIAARDDPLADQAPLTVDTFELLDAQPS